MRGTDVGAHAETIRLIGALYADGLVLLVISFEPEELVGYADRVTIMCDRKQVAEIPLVELFAPVIMSAIAAQEEQCDAPISPEHYIAEKAFSLAGRNIAAGGTAADAAD